MKQETLKELSLQKYPFSNSERNAFITGYNQAKEEQQNMYSEEDLKEAFKQGMDNMDYSDTYGWSSKLTEQEWFNQFKKKQSGE
jgi:predicted oxidoreductase